MIYYVDYYQDHIDSDDTLIDQLEEQIDEHLYNMQIDLREKYGIDMEVDITNQCIIIDERDINKIKLTHGTDILVEYNSIYFMVLLPPPSGEVSFIVDIEWIKGE